MPTKTTQRALESALRREADAKRKQEIITLQIELDTALKAVQLARRAKDYAAVARYSAMATETAQKLDAVDGEAARAEAVKGAAQ